MIAVSIPGWGDLAIHHVVFDFNGTLATDGKLTDSVRNLVGQLRQAVDVQVATADTYGTAREECGALGIEIATLAKGLAAHQKAELVEELGAEHVCCVGNGANDAEMFQVCALGIMVVGGEGGSVKALQAADIVVNNIEDAIRMLLRPDGLRATLRG